MAAVPYAHIVAQLLENKRPKGSDIGLAPNPKDIVSKFIPVFDRNTYDDLHRSGII
jgi:hypothetical protein